MTEAQYKGMSKDRVLELLNVESEESEGGILVAKTPLTMRVFNIVSDSITIPTTMINQENPATLSPGQITEAELKKAGLDVEWLLHCEAIEEIGPRVVASL